MHYDFSGDSLDSYYYHIELLDTSSQIIDSLYFGSQGNPIITTNSWDTVYGGFFGYGPGLRYIRVECGGNDAEGWLGNYGAVIDNSVVSIQEEVFDTICAGDSIIFNDTAR